MVIEIKGIDNNTKSNLQKGNVVRYIKVGSWKLNLGEHLRAKLGHDYRILFTLGLWEAYGMLEALQC